MCWDAEGTGLARQGKNRINHLRTTLRGYWISEGVYAEENHEEILSRSGDGDSARIMVRNAGCENGNLGGLSALSLNVILYFLCQVQTQTQTQTNPSESPGYHSSRRASGVW